MHHADFIMLERVLDDIQYDSLAEKKALVIEELEKLRSILAGESLPANVPYDRMLGLTYLIFVGRLIELFGSLQGIRPFHGDELLIGDFASKLVSVANSLLVAPDSEP